MELIVQLREALDPKVVDWISGKDVTNQVYKLVLLPGQRGKAYLYKLDDNGRIYRQGDEVARYHRSFPVVKVYGKMLGRQ